MSVLLNVVTAARHFADLPTCLLATCVCLLAYLYLQRPRNLPPGPRGWPIVGNLPMLAMSAFTPATLTELSKQYGDVMTIWTGRVPAIVLTGYETIRTALVKRAEDFSSRKIPPFVADIRGDGTTKDTAKGVLMAAYGPHWKHQRKFAMMTLRDFGVGKRSLEGKVNEEANALVQEVLSQNGQPFDLKITMQNAVSNIICSIVFGDRFEYGDPDFLRLIRLLNTTVEAKATIVDRLAIILPAFRHLRLTSKGEKVVKMFQTLQDFCGEQIEKHRQTFDPNDIRDFIDAFLLEQQRAEDEQARENFTDKQLQEVLIDLFMAGTETTATTIRWALLYMMINPEIQEKVHQEIDSVLGQSLPSYAQQNLLPYTTATLAEVQRIKPIGPLSVPHATSRDTTLNGYNIPQGTRILVNLWSVHMDPQLFPEPNQFQPERFLDPDGTFVKHEALIPFGIGHRVCLGEQLAKMELFMLFVSLMQRFTFHLPEGAPKPSMVGSYAGGTIINVPFPFELCAIPRG
ncbi:cytochrome P450 2D4-like isoform X1 [Branchiostoma lanceolatum]|uniref:cytochrome P450 2D4-like isoform X1 n=1 Tax=Branchiostoma lanceolatum TaxID=7740 RepID=UPI003453C067